MKTYRIVQRSKTSWREDGTAELLREGGTYSEDQLTQALIELDARNWLDSTDGGDLAWDIESSDPADSENGWWSPAFEAAVADAADTYDADDVQQFMVIALHIEPETAAQYIRQYTGE